MGVDNIVIIGQVMVRNVGPHFLNKTIPKKYVETSPGVFFSSSFRLASPHSGVANEDRFYALYMSGTDIAVAIWVYWCRS
jgi:hypothetical protein